MLLQRCNLSSNAISNGPPMQLRKAYLVQQSSKISRYLRRKICLRAKHVITRSLLIETSAAIAVCAITMGNGLKVLSSSQICERQTQMGLQNE